jgi:hypothetical protein
MLQRRKCILNKAQFGPFQCSELELWEFRTEAALTKEDVSPFEKVKQCESVASVALLMTQ